MHASIWLDMGPLKGGGVSLQDVGGGRPVAVGTGELPLWGMEVDVAAAAQQLRALGKDDKAEQVDTFLSSLGLGAFAEQLRDLRLGEALSFIRLLDEHE